jgi:hypothetical protein
MRQSAPIFNPAKQQGSSIRQQRRTGVEHAIDGVGPIPTGQDWISGMPEK